MRRFEETYQMFLQAKDSYQPADILVSHLTSFYPMIKLYTINPEKHAGPPRQGSTCSHISKHYISN